MVTLVAGKIVGAGGDFFWTYGDAIGRWLVLPGLLLGLLFRPSVKAQFVRQREHGQMGKDGHG